MTMPTHPATDHTRLATFLIALGVGCASTPGAKPDDMSAQEHQAAAEQHDAEAEAHAAQHDPGAQPAPGSQANIPGRASPSDYNPTAEHARHAETHREHAADHRAAADELEAFEEAECTGFASEVRRSCPLMGKVVSFSDIDEQPSGQGGPAQGPHKRGVRVTFAPDVDVDAVVKHMRCHLAFARKSGRKGMNHCPLYLEGVAIGGPSNSGKGGGKHGVKGHSAAAGKPNPPGAVKEGAWRSGELRVEPGADPRTVDLLIDDEELLNELRTRVRAHVPGGGD